MDNQQVLVRIRCRML